MAGFRIVAVHGNGGGASRFALLTDRFGPDVQFSAVTLPGFEGVPSRPELKTVADYADWLAVEIEAIRAEDPEPAVVALGTGIGGSILLDLASRRPNALEGLILHAIVAASLDTRLIPKVMSRTPVQELMRRVIAARPLRPILSRIFMPGDIQAANVEAFFDGYRTCEVFGQMFDIIDADWFNALALITAVPTALLWGADDRVLSPDQIEALKKKVPGAHVEVRDGWGHFPMLEQPQEYADVVTALARTLVQT